MVFANICKRVKKLEKAFALLHREMHRDEIRFVTYQKDGKKYLVLTALGEDGVKWSKHFIVESIADDRGINTDAIDNEALFKQTSPL